MPILLITTMMSNLIYILHKIRKSVQISVLLIYAPDCLSILKVNLLLDANFILYNGEFRN